MMWFFTIMSQDYTKQCIIESFLSNGAEKQSYLNEKVLVCKTCATRRGHFNPHYTCT